MFSCVLLDVFLVVFLISWLLAVKFVRSFYGWAEYENPLEWCCCRMLTQGGASVFSRRQSQNEFFWNSLTHIFVNEEFISRHEKFVFDLKRRGLPCYDVKFIVDFISQVSSWSAEFRVTIDSSHSNVMFSQLVHELRPWPDKMFADKLTDKMSWIRISVRVTFCLLTYYPLTFCPLIFCPWHFVLAPTNQFHLDDLNEQIHSMIFYKWKTKTNDWELVGSQKEAPIQDKVGPC